jgi:hypothetical protein
MNIVLLGPAIRAPSAASVGDPRSDPRRACTEGFILSAEIGPTSHDAADTIVMEDWTVILRRPDGRLEFEHVEAQSFALERDPLTKNSRTRYYVLRDSDRAEVARFNEKDVVGIRKGRRIEVTAKPDWDW